MIGKGYQSVKWFSTVWRGPWLKWLPTKKSKKISKNPVSPFVFSGYSYGTKSICRVTLNDTVKVPLVPLLSPLVSQILLQRWVIYGCNICQLLKATPPPPKVNLLSLISMPTLWIGYRPSVSLWIATSEWGWAINYCSQYFLLHLLNVSGHSLKK